MYVRTGKTYLYEYDNAGNITAVKTCYLVGKEVLI